MNDTITLSITPELAQAYRDASPAERRRWELFVRYQLESFAGKPRRSWNEITTDLAEQADRNGLTEAELQDILQEWDRDRRR